MSTDVSIASSSDSATVSEVAYRRIRSDIVLGRLTPGRRLPLERMKETYGTSVSTLRELFSRLATEGLLVAEGARGFQVTAVSSANLREVASMRLLLESHGIKESFQRGDLEWEGRVVAAHHKLATMEKRMAANDPYPAETWRQYDWAFHVALISACGSDLLLETYTSICDKYLRYQMIAAIFRGDQAADEHRLLLESALSRNWQQAQQTLITHVEECGRSNVIRAGRALMPLHGTAALAMWWDMAPEIKPEFEDWHSHEHFPERLGVPGFRRASRWTSATKDEGIFVLYELDSHAILSSEAYVSHLNTPTPWSTRMMPHHRDMVRSQCHVLASAGSSVARYALTLRLSPLADRADMLLAFFRTLCAKLAERPGVVGAHLLRHQAPVIAETTEQRIRNSADRVADWVFAAFAYEAHVLESLLEADLAAETLRTSGAGDGAISGLYTLSHSATPQDVISNTSADPLFAKTATPSRCPSEPLRSPAS